MDEDDFEPQRRERASYAPELGGAPFDAREEERPRGWMLLALIVVGVAALTVIIFNTYKFGARERNDGNPPRIASPGEFKSQPDDPGGFTAPGQDLTIYDPIEGTERAEVLSPADVREEMAELPESTDEMAIGGPPTDIRPRSDGQAADLADINSLPDEEDGPSLGVADPGTAPARAQPQPETRPAPQTAPASTPATNPAPAPVTAAIPSASGFRFAAGGGYLVQLAAVRSDEEAGALFDRLAAAHPDLFAGGSRNVMRADLGDKGVFYRVRIGTFADRANASAFCEALKARGGDCLIVSP